MSSSRPLLTIKCEIKQRCKMCFKSCWKFVLDKLNCHICDHILEELEKIDDECDVYGIHMVKIQDPQLAKRYSIKTFPAMVYFR